MNPICRWNQTFLHGKIQQCDQNIALYRNLGKVTHVALSVLALICLVSFGLIDPSYLLISSTLLFFAYFPALEVTVGTLRKWVSEVKKEQEKYRAILSEVRIGTPILQAQINALKEIDLPCFKEKEKLCSESPSSETLRLELLGLKRKRARIILMNARRHVEIAFIQHVERNQADQRSLSDFGSFKRWPIDCLLNDSPFTVFISTKGRAFTNHDDFSEIFS